MGTFTEKGGLKQAKGLPAVMYSTKTVAAMNGKQIRLGGYPVPLESDAKGNSTRGLKVCMDLAEKFHLHGFSSAVSRKPFMEQVKQLGSRPTRQVSAETLA